MQLNIYISSHVSYLFIYSFYLFFGGKESGKNRRERTVAYYRFIE